MVPKARQYYEKEWGSPRSGRQALEVVSWLRQKCSA
jgi:hypothetical protein